MPSKLTGLSTSTGVAGFAVNLIFLSLAVVAVGLRIWTTTVIKRRLAAHDYLTFGALIFAIVYAAVYGAAIHPGIVGLHMSDALAAGPDAFVTTFKLFFVAGFIWTASTTLVKLSMLHFYHFVFQKGQSKYVQNPVFRWLGHALYMSTILFFLSHTIVLFAECKPIEFNWNKSLESGHCSDQYKRQLSNCIINMILDLGIVIVPMPVLWTLKTSLVKKIRIGAMFSLGLLICAMNATRTRLTAHTDPTNSTYELVNIGLFAGLEVYIGILTACLPLLAPLIFSNSSKGNSAAYPGNKRSGTQSKLVPTRSGAPPNHDGFGHIDDDNDVIALKNYPQHNAYNASTSSHSVQDTNNGIHV